MSSFLRRQIIACTTILPNCKPQLKPVHLVEQSLSMVTESCCASPNYLPDDTQLFTTFVNYSVFSLVQVRLNFDYTTGKEKFTYILMF